MLNLFKKYFDYNERELNRLRKKVEEINAQEDNARKVKDKDFAKETKRMKEQIRSGEKTLDSLLPWAMALVREAARRTLGQRHFDVQLIAGVALHEGKVAEQKTGEGKTLSATTALYLNALEGQGTHLVTVNDYLARRDAGWMGKVFHFLGLTTSAIISEKSFLYDPEYEDKDSRDWRLSHLRPVSRKEAYEADVTYGINSEFGFDYLRDNMAQNPNELVQRGFHFAIIDEADSVLIDEARTPHIISAPYTEDTSKYYKYAKIVTQLDEKTDYVIDEKLRTANLTEDGIKKIESLLGVENIYEKDFDTLFHVEAALKAITLFKKDKDYIVKENEVIIVDEFTGRLLFGRRFSEGLHQAIEAKEGVTIQKESKTLATVSLQNYFRMYAKLAGMTGTAATESEEFHKIYKTNVIVVPTHLPMVRKDHPDMIYKTERAKYDAVVNEIADNYKKGRPVLVGTTSIEKNEYLSKLLTQKAIPHELLNAKNHEREAQIIAKAGAKRSVTIATNMAGRGVDIILGGEPPSELSVKPDRLKAEERKWQEQHDEVVQLGGLYVIGTERHESRRIDNQLRGRSGRQGDPGQTRFFVSLQDDLMRIFGGEQISNLMTLFKLPEDQPLTHSMVSKAIEQAQVKVEGFNFDIRKHLVDFDDVLNKQREIIYALRKKMLGGPDKAGMELRLTVMETFNEELQSLANVYFMNPNPTAGDLSHLVQEINMILPVDRSDVEKHAKSKDSESLSRLLMKSTEEIYAQREKKMGKDLWSEVVKMVYLSTIDKYWMDHLTAIEDLREGINLRGYAQLDPLVEYKNEAYGMFERLVGSINFEATRRLFKLEVNVVQNETQEQDNSALPQKSEDMVYKSATSVDPYKGKARKMERKDDNGTMKVSYYHKGELQKVEEAQASQQKTEVGGFSLTPPGQSRKKPGRNDPCWCGSGKKYKKCHYPN